MNLFFSKTIKAGDKLREFNFKKLPGDTDLRYHVDVADDSGKRLSFTIYKNPEGNWKTTAQRLPLWVHNSEVLIGDAIEEEQKAMPVTK